MYRRKLNVWLLALGLIALALCLPTKSVMAPAQTQYTALCWRSDKEKMVVTPTYHVFRMYRVHQGATMIPVDITAPQYKFGDASFVALNVSASRDEQARVHLSVINLDPNRASEITTTISGGVIRTATGEILTASAMNSMNMFDRPNTVKPAPFSGYKLQGSQLSLNIPAKSVVVLELQ